MLFVKPVCMKVKLNFQEEKNDEEAVAGSSEEKVGFSLSLSARKNSEGWSLSFAFEGLLLCLTSNALWPYWLKEGSAWFDVVKSI